MIYDWYDYDKTWIGFVMIKLGLEQKTFGTSFSNSTEKNRNTQIGQVGDI